MLSTCLPFHRVRASSWWSRGWPSFPDPPLDHFRARDTKATRSGEFGSIKLNSLARFSKNNTNTDPYATSILCTAPHSWSGSTVTSLQGKAEKWLAWWWPWYAGGPSAVRAIPTDLSAVGHQPHTPTGLMALPMLGSRSPAEHSLGSGKVQHQSAESRSRTPPSVQWASS